MELYKHNKEAYKKVEAMFKSQDKVAIVHATGTGKSFISLKWLFDNKDKKCLFLAPSYAIIDQLEQHIKSQGLTMKDFPNLKCMIYPNLVSMSDDKLNNLRVDNVVLDEFHRCGAEVWGKCINTILSNNPGAKVLGTTATPIRYLDNNRNMAEELFHGNIASEVTLSDAIADGILPMPTYISAVYSFEEDINRVQNKINLLDNSADKDMLQQELEEAKRRLQMADGLSNVFERHIPNKSGKYIAFCRDYQHMQTMMHEARDWFKNVNSKVDIYSVYSKQGRDLNQQDISKFEKSNNNHIKLLFSIEMLNEGLHVEDVDGVIMLRPTASTVVYTQQLGRALSVGHNEHPIVFDIVNNINCHKIIHQIYQDVQSKLEKNKHAENINLKNFKIIDELRDSNELLESLDNLLDRNTYLKNKCERIVQDLIAFKKQVGHVPSMKSKDPNEVSLMRMLGKYKNEFSDEQVNRLKINGMILNHEEKNTELILDVCTFIESKHEMPSRTTEDITEKKLYERFMFHKNHDDFNEEQNNFLEEIKKEFIKDRFDVLINFIKQYGMPSGASKDKEELSLHTYFKKHKKKFSSKQLDVIAKAKKLAGVKDRVEFNEFLAFVKVRGLPSRHSKSEEELRLYNYYIYRISNNRFTDNQIKELVKAGIPMEKISKKFQLIINQQNINVLKEPVKEKQQDDKIQ